MKEKITFFVFGSKYYMGNGTKGRELAPFIKVLLFFPPKIREIWKKREN